MSHEKLQISKGRDFHFLRRTAFKTIRVSALRHSRANYESSNFSGDFVRGVGVCINQIGWTSRKCCKNTSIAIASDRSNISTLIFGWNNVALSKEYPFYNIALDLLHGDPNCVERYGSIHPMESNYARGFSRENPSIFGATSL